MTKPECPLPQVEDALAPYINTREKTTRIRQILTEHLRRQTKDSSGNRNGDEGITHLSLSVPTTSLLPRHGAESGRANGLYDQYLKALQAHQTAREQYDSVKEELNHLLQGDASTNGHTSSLSPTTNQVLDYTTLLRQRRHLRKLEIVQDTLTRLVSIEPNPASVDIKTSVRDEIGDPPQPPVIASSTGNLADAGGGGNADAEARVRDLTFQLKKELLVARNRFAEARAVREERMGSASATPSADMEGRDAVEVIRQVRDELISWVESELAKIPEDEVEASQVEISFLGGGDEEVTEQDGRQLSNEELSARVERLYETYLSSRQRYITQVETALALAPKLRETANTTSGARPPSPQRQAYLQPSTPTTTNGNTTITAADLLPTLAHLTATTQTTTLLQSQTAHLRKQLITASAEQSTLIQRLAGESLLVPQDSTDVGAWTKAAGEAGAKTRELVMGCVIEGEASVAQARKVMEGLRARRMGLEGLRRDL